MARPSRPPGFDMTYRPEKRETFGPPISQRLPSVAYLVFALSMVAVVVYGQEFAPSSSRIFEYVVEGDRHRVVSSSACAIILALSAVAAFARELMRGVIVHPDGIEMRELLTFGLPRVRRFHWSQIDRVFVPTAGQGEASRAAIRLDLWDGTRTWLPHVGEGMRLAILLERVALARAIPVEGGTGLIDDLGNPLEDG